MTEQVVERDERTVAVENASYRWAYLVLSYGLLLCTAYRSFFLGQASWDLLALVVVGGAVAATYQGTRRVLSRRWAVLSGVAVLAALILAAALVLIAR